MHTPLIPESTTYGRRSFLKKTTAILLAASTLSGLTSCSKNSDEVNNKTFDVGSGDMALLNISYALKQLELAFYSKLNEAYYPNIDKREKELLDNIRIHEYVHVTLLKETLGSNAIGDLQFDFSKIDFTNRTAVLNIARLIENTGVACFNGLAYLFVNVDYMAVVGKISSVEARHATVINNFISFGNFIDSQSVDPTTSMDRPLPPDQVVKFINDNYTVTQISATTL